MGAPEQIVVLLRTLTRTWVAGLILEARVMLGTGMSVKTGGTKTCVVRESSRSGYKGTGRDPLRRGRDKRLGRNQSRGFEGR